MKIHVEYLKKIITVIEKMEEIDRLPGDLYTTSSVILRDGEEEGSQEFYLEYDGDFGCWILNTDKSKDVP